MKLASAGEFPDFLCQPILDALREEFKFDQMTPVQASVIPPFVQSHKDLVVHSMTGSGKTLAFLVPLLELLLEKGKKGGDPLLKNQVGAMIITPTRELARQIYGVAERFFKHFWEGSNCCVLTMKLLVGGSSIDDDIRILGESCGNHSPDSLPLFDAFIGPNVLIGTPGRILDVMNKMSGSSSSLSFKNLEVLVLDEGDRLLDMGFETSLNAIISRLPKQRRTCLFSATMTDALGELVRVGLRNPVKVTVKHFDGEEDEARADADGSEAENDDGDDESPLSAQVDRQTPATLQIYSLVISAREKLAYLIKFLEAGMGKHKVMVYFSTCASVDYFREIIVRVPELNKLKVLSIHGRMVAKKRQGVMDQFSKARAAVLLCTDVTARGVDIPEIDWVIQYDPPQDPKVFVHRCGRSARLGSQGQAVVFLQPHEDLYLDFLKVRKVPISPYPIIEEGDDESQPIVSAAPITIKKIDEAQLNAVADLVHSLNARDRSIFETSRLAFVSFVRSYQEHQASYIFRFKKLDLIDLIRSFYLLNVPRMPELKDKGVDTLWTPPIPNLDTSAIPYRDKKREQSRQLRMLKEAAANAAAAAQSDSDDDENGKGKRRNQAWSRTIERREKRLKRKETKKRKKEYLEKSKKDNNGSDDEEDHSSEEEMEEDYRSIKREKKKMRKLAKGAVVPSDILSDAEDKAESDIEE